jgi:hypothetical protein
MIPSAINSSPLPSDKPYRAESSSIFFFFT